MCEPKQRIMGGWFSKTPEPTQTDCEKLLNVWNPDNQTLHSHVSNLQNPPNSNRLLHKLAAKAAQDLQNLQIGPETKEELRQIERYIIQSNTPRTTRRRVAKCANLIKSAMYFASENLLGLAQNQLIKAVRHLQNEDEICWNYAYVHAFRQVKRIGPIKSIDPSLDAEEAEQIRWIKVKYD
ncbi:hypothetical protein OAM67_00485 [bacterium]|nr:hypothetical protein [bacterium]